MINLSVIDRMNEQLNSITTTQVGSKIDELKGAIGKRFSDNHSSTNSSMLMSVSKCGNVCYTMELPSEYKSGNQTPKVGMVKQPSWLVWNAMFF
tara:strand:+ start:3816 stop:4097 length:282 start_codon:yes stop_codon:yes gene_type:complete